MNVERPCRRCVRLKRNCEDSQPKKRKKKRESEPDSSPLSTESSTTSSSFRPPTTSEIYIDHGTEDHRSGGIIQLDRTPPSQYGDFQLEEMPAMNFSFEMIQRYPAPPERQTSPNDMVVGETDGVQTVIERTWANPIVELFIKR